jgi:hypothetical protein
MQNHCGASAATNELRQRGSPGMSVDVIRELA